MNGSDGASERTIVVGGGLAGATTLYELARRGVAATLLEAREGIALETSFANGAMLTPSMSDPWNGPGVGRHLSSSLFDPHAAMKLRGRALPGLVFWGIRFLRHSTPARHRAATLSNFQLAADSLRRTETLRDALGIECDASETGTMKLFATREAMMPALEIAEMLARGGLVHRVLDRDATLEVEPQLRDVRDRIAGALHFPDDRCADAFAFTHALVEEAQALGAEVRTGTRVIRLLAERGRVTGVETDRDTVEATRIVIAGGNGSVPLARTLGVALPIKPVKGYSLTAELTGVPAPRIAVVDEAMHAAVVPLGSRVRVVGTAEFTGHDTRLHPARVENLRRVFARLYPSLAEKIDPTSWLPWAGLRPVTPDGVPHIGESRVPGLWVNAGHGHLGWTMAMGSAALVCDLMLGSKPAIDPAPYRVHR